MGKLSCRNRVEDPGRQAETHAPVIVLFVEVFLRLEMTDARPLQADALDLRFCGT